MDRATSPASSWKLPKPTGNAFAGHEASTAKMAPREPQTPFKPERAKFVCPANLTPFTYSPALLKTAESFPQTSLGLENPVHRTATSMLGPHSSDSILLSASKSPFHPGAVSSSPIRNLKAGRLGTPEGGGGNCTSDESEDDGSFDLKQRPKWISSDVNFFVEGISLKYDGDYLHDNFRIVALLGQGSFSQVFKAQSHSGDYFAIKKSSNSSIGLINRMQEAFHLSSVSECDNCVRMITAWEQFGFIYVQTELCGRGSVQDLLSHSRRSNAYLSFLALKNLLNQAATGLAHIHLTGLLHLDIKSSNILISDDGVLKIADFGMSHMYQEASTGIDSEGDKVYIAPEVLLGLQTFTSDIYSLGLVMVEVSTNLFLPASGKEWNELRNGIFRRIVFPPHIPASFAALILSMLSPEPRNRPSAEFIASCTEDGLT